jgi:hypothetical protein
VCNLTRPKAGEKIFIIPSALVYIILKELEKIKDKCKEKTIKTLTKSSYIEIASNLLHNTLKWGSKNL